jgi:hypothetical protein
MMVAPIALSQKETAYVTAVKRGGLLFGILYGALLFRKWRLGIHLVAGGLMVVKAAKIATSTL